jgi:hypothetical protein
VRPAVAGAGRSPRSRQTLTTPTTIEVITAGCRLTNVAAAVAARPRGSCYSAASVPIARPPGRPQSGDLPFRDEQDEEQPPPHCP